MIRVHKNAAVPCGYNREQMTKQLILDQHGKCYICERICHTDYEIEHHHSQANHPDEVNVWENQFLACSYCNGKKLHHFDQMFHPSSCNIEDLIKHQNDFLNKEVLFVPLIDNSAAKITSELLSRIFNGIGKRLRTTREERFYEYFLSNMNHFLSLVNAYIENDRDKFTAIVEELAIDKEFLGFKYWIIKDNPKLYSDFGDQIIWNKS